MELVVLSRLYDRSIVVYNELRESREVQEQVFPSVQDEESGCTVDKLTNPVSLFVWVFYVLASSPLSPPPPPSLPSSLPSFLS